MSRNSDYNSISNKNMIKEINNILNKKVVKNGNKMRLSDIYDALIDNIINSIDYRKIPHYVYSDFLHLLANRNINKLLEFKKLYARNCS